MADKAVEINDLYWSKSYNNDSGGRGVRGDGGRLDEEMVRRVKEEVQKAMESVMGLGKSELRSGVDEELRMQVTEMKKEI